MRQIKFRAWLKDEKKMVDVWSLHQCQDGTYIDVKRYEGMSLYEIELMQFTGLLDKDGKEIYEGDILNHKTTFQNNMDDRRFQPQTEVEVGFKNGCFIDVNSGLSLYEKIYSIVSHEIDYEIIGNIHDN